MAASLPPSIDPPRVCTMKKWADFDGYGFNLHAEKNKPGQFIGKIDADSPADAAGLREGDRIVEVNGVNVNLENHKQVVIRIKALAQETRLLVVDRRCDAWHREEQVVVRAGLPYTLHLSSEPEARGPEQEPPSDEEVIDTRLQRVEMVEAPGPEAALPPAVRREDSIQSQSSAVSSVDGGKQPGNSVSSGSLRSTPSPTDSPDLGLNLNMTAKEMRERLGSQKKRDPRKDSNRHDMRRKFEMIQAL